MAALTFGNVHGVYKPGNVVLKPELLKEIQDGIAGQVRDRPEAARPGLPRRIRLVRCGDRRGRRERRHQDEHRHRHPVRLQPLGRRHGAAATTTASSRSTARSATRRSTTRAPGARSPRPRWRRAWSRRRRQLGLGGQRASRDVARRCAGRQVEASPAGTGPRSTAGPSTVVPQRQVVRREVHDAAALGQLHVEAHADRGRAVGRSAQLDEKRPGVRARACRGSRGAARAARCAAPTRIVAGPVLGVDHDEPRPRSRPSPASSRSTGSPGRRAGVGPAARRAPGPPG